MYPSKRNRPIVFLACSGLGNINRGYESFSQECFEALKNSEAFELYLIKGGGKKRDHEIVIPNFSRNNKAAGYISRLLEKEPYHIEQASFCMCLIPLIVRKRPALIYYSDFITGTYLWHLRRLLKFKYRLLFANGAPNGPPYKTEDHVQQLLRVYHSIGVKCDGPSKHTCLPYAFDINIEGRKRELGKKEIIRKRLGFSSARRIILAVGAVNMRHKRMDYVINEVAALDKNFYLVIVGQYDQETKAVVELANEKLPGRHTITNIPHAEISDYYIAADYFVLASLQEGFPRVTIEALSYGLPCIVHDHIIMRQILKEYGTYADMRFEGVLSGCLKKMDNASYNKKNMMQYAYDAFSWEKRKNDYEDMILKQLSAQAEDAAILNTLAAGN